jgi:ubiquinol-cytochrome c reductase cytochrome b subunit
VNLSRRAQETLKERLPYEELLPDRLPFYVSSLVYSFGALTLGSFLMLILSGLVMVANGPLWWQASGFGHFMHAVHFWSAQTFFFFLLLHLTSQFFMGSWRQGRVLTWMVGVLTFGVAVVEAFIGYLSRGDFFSQWNQVQGKDAFNAIGAGAWLNLLNNGQLYGLHISVLPAILILLVGLHLFLVRSKGLVAPMEPDPGEEGPPAARAATSVPASRALGESGGQRP